MNAGRLPLVGVIVIVVAAILAGIVISGSPAEQRRLRADDRRVTDLQRVASALQIYYRSTRKLPPDLATLQNGWASAEVPRDPDTGADYDYEVGGASSYRLCAEFARDSRPNAQPEFWSHGEGRHCYTLDYSELVLD